MNLHKTSKIFGVFFVFIFEEVYRVFHMQVYIYFPNEHEYFFFRQLQYQNKQSLKKTWAFLTPCIWIAECVASKIRRNISTVYARSRFTCPLYTFYLGFINCWYLFEVWQHFFDDLQFLFKRGLFLGEGKY